VDQLIRHEILASRRPAACPARALVVILSAAR
jgi:hypothetical protein